MSLAVDRGSQDHVRKTGYVWQWNVVTVGDINFVDVTRITIFHFYIWPNPR